MKTLEMQTKRIQKEILTVLTRQWQRNGPPGIMDIKDIAGRSNLPMSTVRKNLEPLFTDGSIDLDQIGFAAFLTPEGYERACEDGNHPKHE